MPANRSRTDRWRDSLRQIAQRGGGLELSVARGTPAERGPDLLWRVRLLGMTDQELLVEQPLAVGRSLAFVDGLELVGVMSVGQNRWMFRTRVLGTSAGPSPFGARPGMRVAMPTSVERCARREFLRASTAELHLPELQCWPLLDPSSVVAAEVANRARILELQAGAPPAIGEQSADSILLPEVGAPFKARLMNIGGGGLGLVVAKEDASAAERSRLLWTRVNLMPLIPAPLAITARVVHTHLDSTQSLYLGVAFEFVFNAPHREFVVDQVTRYVRRIQSDAARAA